MRERAAPNGTYGAQQPRVKRLVHGLRMVDAWLAHHDDRSWAHSTVNIFGRSRERLPAAAACLATAACRTAAACLAGAACSVAAPSVAASLCVAVAALCLVTALCLVSVACPATAV